MAFAPPSRLKTFGAPGGLNGSWSRPIVKQCAWPQTFARAQVFTQTFARALTWPQAFNAESVVETEI